MTSKISLRHSFWYLLLTLFFFNCNKDDTTKDVPAYDLENEKADIAVKWADMTLYTARYSFFNTPTYCSRAL